MLHFIKYYFNRIYSNFYLNHDNSLFFSKWNFFRLKHKVLKKEKKDLSFFNYHYNNSIACGPLQKDEAVFLFGLISCIKPKCILELGFHKGHSALALLNALDSDSAFTTIDIDPNCLKIFAEKFSNRFKNARMIINDMSVVNFNSFFRSNEIDFVFFDAVHDLELNIKTYLNLKPYLTSDCIIVIHDTGLWFEKYMEEVHYSVLKNIKSKKVLEDAFAHQLDERLFVNYLVSKEQYNTFHIHSKNTIRHGITCLHKQNEILLT